MFWSELLAFATLGLLGSVHCAGMCGGFAVGVAAGARDRRRTLVRFALYFGGKTLSYALLGLIAAQSAGILTRAGASLLAHDPAGRVAWFEASQRCLALVAGVAFLWFGFSALGWLPRWKPSQRGPRLLAPLFKAARSLDGDAGVFGLGLVNGLLPCGLTWAALALAVNQTPVVSVLGMVVFGLATAPILSAVGIGTVALSAPVRARLALVFAPVFLAFGLVTLARGGVPLRLGSLDATPECCAEEPNRK